VFDLDHPPESSSEVTDHTFPRFVTSLFIRGNSVYDSFFLVAGWKLRRKHFRKVSTYIHSDRNPDPTLSEMMKHLSTSSELHWKEIVEDTEMKTAKLWEDGGEAQFSARGPKHRKMADLYNAYVQTLEAALLKYYSAQSYSELLQFERGAIRALNT